MRIKKSKKINGLEWAFWLMDVPQFIKNSPPKGINAASKAGLAFERKVYKHLKNLFNGMDEKDRHKYTYGYEKGQDVVHNPWFKFKDSNKTHWCSPDILLFRHGRYAILIECKLKTTPLAEDTLNNLYLPLCKSIFPNYKWRTAQVSKHLSKGWEGPVIYTLAELLKTKRKFVTLIWSE